MIPRTIPAHYTIREVCHTELPMVSLDFTTPQTGLVVAAAVVGQSHIDFF